MPKHSIKVLNVAFKSLMSFFIQTQKFLRKSWSSCTFQTSLLYFPTRSDLLEQMDQRSDTTKFSPSENHSTNSGYAYSDDLLDYT